MTLAHAQKYFVTMAVLTCDCSFCSSKKCSDTGALRSRPHDRRPGAAAPMAANPRSGESVVGAEHGRLKLYHASVCVPSRYCPDIHSIHANTRYPESIVPESRGRADAGSPRT